MGGGSEQKISTGAGFYVVRTKERFTEISSHAVQYIADRFLHGLKFLSVYLYYILVATYMPKMERLKSNFIFRERGALGHLSFWSPQRCDVFGHLPEKRESMHLLCFPSNAKYSVVK